MGSRNKKGYFFAKIHPLTGLPSSQVDFIEEKAPFFYDSRAHLLFKFASF
jgi:hypothetical protein